MSLKSFAKLKEYDSLLRMRLGHLNEIKEQNERLQKLARQSDDRRKEVEDLITSHLRIQQDLADLEAKLKLATEQRQRLLDYGGDEQKIKDLAVTIAGLEEQGLELLGLLEENEAARAEGRTFLEGIARTQNDIGTEVREIEAREKAAVSQLDQRLGLLLSELPSDFRDLLQRVLAKNLAHGPFTRTDQGSCFFCRYKISRIDESEIDIQRRLKTCPQCGRIFVPFGT